MVATLALESACVQILSRAVMHLPLTVQVLGNDSMLLWVIVVSLILSIGGQDKNVQSGPKTLAEFNEAK